MCTYSAALVRMLPERQIKQSLNDATERVFAGVQTSQQALDQACREIDAALAAAY